ncbi:MAG: N-acetylglucosamine-6-phosphate deacetylase [Cellulosilyticaceae bacterium]
MKAIINGKILHEEQELIGKALLFDEKIQGIVECDDEALKGAEIIDAKGRYVSAGFIDLHIHGYSGCDTMDGTVEAIETIAKGICENGVTSFLPTTMTMSKEAITTALEAARIVKNKGCDGAEVIGVHMEGPYVNTAFKGAQNATYIQSPTKEEIDYVKKYQDIVKIITIAPEIEGATEFIKEVSENTDIILSMGHTAASYEEAMTGIECGISHTTHLFNAMTGLHHRTPGVVGAALSSDVSVEMICDTIHVNTGLYPLVVKAKAPDKFVLVTDCTCAGGCKDGEYALGGQKVILKEGSVRLQDGTLAGSVLKLNEALLNILKNTNKSLKEAIAYASLNPAKAIGVEDKKGTLHIGKDADIIIFDENINIQYTINKGRTIYENN